MILTHLVLFSFLAGAGGAEAPPAVAETFSGGWRHWPRDETDTAREARIKSERVKLGIIEPDPPQESEEVHSGEVDSESTIHYPLSPDPGLAVDLAELYTSAYLDQEIARHFWLQDEDDAAVLLLAIAALH